MRKMEVIEVNGKILYKRCGRCKSLHKPEDFHKRRDKLTSRCKVCHKLDKKDSYRKNKDPNKNRAKLYYQQNRNKCLEQAKFRYQNSKEAKKDYDIKYRENNKERMRLQVNDYQRKRREDPLYKLKMNVSCLIRNSLRNLGYYKKTRSVEILGCSVEEFQKHLEESFYLVYNRYVTEDDKLHIDHIIPISTAKTNEDVIKLNHYTNLRWLLASDNQKKSNKLDYVIEVDVEN